MADVDGPTWKVGQLARLTGLTVRTLHHSGQVGLLCPSARTPSGHRLYDEQDICRLYRVVALRELGLPLEVIGDLLTGEPDLAVLLRDHLAHVDQQLAAIHALRRRLAAMVAAAVLEFVHGGDPGLRDGMYRMQADNSEMLQQQYGGPSPEQIDYIRRANAVSSS